MMKFKKEVVFGLSPSWRSPPMGATTPLREIVVLELDSDPHLQSKSYTFERTEEAGQRWRWTGQRAVIDLQAGTATFTLDPAEAVAVAELDRLEEAPETAQLPPHAFKAPTFAEIEPVVRALVQATPGAAHTWYLRKALDHFRGIGNPRDYSEIIKTVLGGQHDDDR